MSVIVHNRAHVGPDLKDRAMDRPFTIHNAATLIDGVAI